MFKPNTSMKTNQPQQHSPRPETQPPIHSIPLPPPNLKKNPHHLQMQFLLLLLILLPYLLFSTATSLGVNWGTSSSHPLPPPKVVTGLLRANNITKVKLSDANPDVLDSLSGSHIGVIVGIPNEMLAALNSSKKAARSWVHDNVTRYFPSGGVGGGVKIEYIAVGDEPFLLSYGQQFQPFVIGAALNIGLALKSAKLADKVKIIVPCSSDVYQSNSTSNSSLPLPSSGHFRSDINKTMSELLFFLANQGSPFVVDINPFSSFLQTTNLSMDHLLFHPKSHVVTDGHNKYKNFFDASIDTLVSSLSKAGYSDMEIMVGRIGWPTDGANNATSTIAQMFVDGLIEHLKSKAGTPVRPKRPPVETYIFSLLDEDQRTITSGNFERHWGVFTFDGQAKYNVDLGQGSRELVNAHNVDYLAPRWCVVDNNKELLNISASFSDACSNADCTALSPGGSCSRIGWPGNVSYGFNSYYQKNDQSGESCDFGGMGLITTVDPSTADCRFAIALSTSSSASLRNLQLLQRAKVLFVCTLLSFAWFRPG